MLNLKKIVGIIAIVAVIGFVFFSCEEDSGGGGGSSTGMETLTLSGKVYFENWSENETVSYTQFNGSAGIVSSNGGSGSITNGNLSYEIGRPNYLYTMNKSDAEEDLYGYDISLSPTSVQAYVLDELQISGNNGYLYKRSSSTNVSSNSGTAKYENVVYVYVDCDVTITGTGGTETETDTYDGTTYTGTYTTRNFSLALKTGWNAIYHKEEISSTFTGPVSNPTSVTYTLTVTVSLSNPNLRWILYDYVAPPTIPPASSTSLTVGTWANGNITSSSREQYFRFTASASTHYIHFEEGTLDDVYVEVYSANGSLVDYRQNLYGSYTSAQQTGLSDGQTYYIRIYPYYSDEYGSYRIAVNTSYSSPSGSIVAAPSFNVQFADETVEKPKSTQSKSLLKKIVK